MGNTSGLMDGAVIAAIVSATQDVFSTMLGMEVVPGNPFVARPEAAMPASGMMSLIGIAGAWTGTGSVHCSEAFACKAAGALLMMEQESANEDVLDAMAEIANMVIGNVKTALEERLHTPLALSTPTLIFGQSFQTRSGGRQEWTVVPFSCGKDRFHIQICLTPEKSKEAQCATRGGVVLPQVVSF